MKAKGKRGRLNMRKKEGKAARKRGWKKKAGE